jgi:hypothetical protein
MSSGNGMSVQNRVLWYTMLLSLSTVPALAQTRKPPLQDNSFLIEEAYNQEAGVVQHISTFARPTNGSLWVYNFTQEWPVRGQSHQLSYTVPILRVDDTPGVRAGLGDVALHYRYQLVGAGDAPIAVAPRLSALLPTGSNRRGLGAGGWGMQINLPLSVALPGTSLVTHSNAGMTYVRRARNSVGESAATVGYNAAQSVVWLARPRFNLMVEGAWQLTEEVVAPGRTERSTALLLSPGVRGGIDFASGLQIVPGIAFPIGVGPSRGERNVLLYLSFEHPFIRATP